MGLPVRGEANRLIKFTAGGMDNGKYPTPISCIAAARNSEDLNLIASRPVAEAYAAYWREHLAGRSPSPTTKIGAGSHRRERLPVLVYARAPVPVSILTGARAAQSDASRARGLRRGPPAVRQGTLRPAPGRTPSGGPGVASDQPQGRADGRS
jgi:hypothetical protein